MRGSEPRRGDPAGNRRRTTGLVGLWTTGLATMLVLAMLIALMAIVAVNAFGWFWPSRISELELTDGSVRIGIVSAREEIPSMADPEAAVVHRLQLKVGNRELTRSDFVWLDEALVVSRSAPEDLVRVVRTEYGDAFGRIVRAYGAGGAAIPSGAPDALEALLDAGRQWRTELRRFEKQRDRLRHPLTRLEERLDILERSARADSLRGRAEISTLDQEVAAAAAQVRPQLDAVEGEIELYRERLRSARLVLASGDDEIEVPLSNVVEIVAANRMGAAARVWHALRQGVKFLFEEPREANTEGGIYPALFGTVLLVLLMSIAVVPLGVVTAVYMTEYARPGLPLSLANQAVNNLAGVPSIVFGMFGLAFFIYQVGGSIDELLFADRLPTPTFGTGGVLWASLTLALLTVPVVVVATREGLLAVPRNWRDGSLALGATRWQTLKHIILPAATPGILTGLILAVSRAAGEVAPLMLTGAAKLAPSLPVDGTPPFLHLQRKFMHLGFHIYDVSMQSPNVEAAKPMAFATTLVLLLLVVLLNLTAIIVRRRLRQAYKGQVV